MPLSNIEHFLVQTTDMARTRDWFVRALGVEFKQRQVDDQGLYQLFMFDPNGIKIELNYDSAEAQGLHAEVMASELRS